VPLSERPSQPTVEQHQLNLTDFEVFEQTLNCPLPTIHYPLSTGDPIPATNPRKPHPLDCPDLLRPFLRRPSQYARRTRLPFIGCRMGFRKDLGAALVIIK
jgi:hypothetical protein